MAKIYTIALDGGDLRQLTFEGRCFFPSWSPDGNQIAYDNAHSIWIMNADGSDKREIGPSTGGRMPSWSHDGSRIVFIGYRTQPPYTEIFVMSPTEENVHRLSYNSTDDRYPVYSPDDRFIAYTGDLQEGPELEDRIPQIWVMKADGTEARRLTTNGGSHPSWSPDGRTIVFRRANVCNSPGDGVLWTIDVATGVERQLTRKWPERRP